MAEDIISGRLPRGIACFVGAVLGLLILLVFSAQFILLWAKFDDPVTVYRSQVVNSPVHPGAELIVEYDFLRERACRGEIGFSIMRMSDKTTVWWEILRGGTLGIGKHEGVRVAVRLPQGFAPGLYELNQTIFNTCREGDHANILNPEKFEVVR